MGSPKLNYSNKQCSMELSKHRAIFVLAVAFGALIFFCWIGSSFHHTNPSDRIPIPITPTNNDPNNDDISKRLMANVDPQKISEVLNQLTVEPHVAGTEANKKVADKIAEIWKQNGLQDVHFTKYNVLLSYPNFTQPNHATILDGAGGVVYRTKGLSPDLNPHSSNKNPNDYRSTIQWLAYSADGTVEGDAVYCHYGTPADFERLKDMNISLKGNIAIMRYNTDFRGDKVKHAEVNGAIGAIIYSDPTEVAGDGTDESQVYPFGFWLPSGGVQRGSILESDGDPLTPVLPARPDLYPKFTLEEAKQNNVLPKIPVIPLSYQDAYQILSRLVGPDVPADWQGGLNFTYHIGPGFNDETKLDDNEVSDKDDKKFKLQLEVHSQLEKREIQNVIGYVYGEDLDSYVMLGNHYDAWVYGSIDPNSGTAILAEVARAFTSTVATGWKPKRTLMFCAWDAEEYGLIGSTEFVQEFAEVLKDRAIIYLNVDLISSNQTLDVRTTPTVYQSVVDVAKKVANPVESERKAGRETVYDTWLKYFPSETKLFPDYPKMVVPGGGSDQMSFLNFLGVPVVDLTYRNASWNSYPLYHSMYEVPYVNEHIFDVENLAVHKAVAQYWGELARYYADAPVIPLNVTVLAQKLLVEYISDVKAEVEDLQKEFPDETKDARQQVSKLIANAQEFLKTAEKFEVDVVLLNLPGIPNAGKSIGRLNRRLQKLEQCFINPTLGLAATDPEKRHVLYSLSSADSYSARVMAAIFDVVHKFRRAKTAEERAKVGRELAYQITVVQYSVQCATNLLEMNI